MNLKIDKDIENKIDIIQGNIKVEEYVIALDIGKYETKAIGRPIEGTVDDIKRINFRTKMYDLSNGYIDVEGNSHKVKFGGKEFIIGEQGETKSTDTSKTNLLHQLSAYVAITRFLKTNTHNRINLVLACPISVLKIAEAKEAYKNFIKGNGVITIEVGDKTFKFEIENVTIKAEGSGILFTEPEFFKGKNIGIIDFGGLNMGVSIYRNSVCKQNDRFIEEFGANKLTLYVKDAMTSLNNGNVVGYDTAEQALENGHMKELGEIRADSLNKIKEVKQKFLFDAIEIIKTNSIKLEEFDGLVFVGGTTQKLKEQVLKKYPNASIPNNSQWTTVEGLYMVACAKYGKGA